MKHDQPGRGATKKFWVRTAVLGVMVAAPMAVFASPAYAATGVSKNGSQLTVTAAAGTPTTSSSGVRQTGSSSSSEIAGTRSHPDRDVRP